jgi:hypothetical protein
MKKITLSEEKLTSLIKKIVSETEFMDFDTEPIEVMQINLETYKAKKHTFSNYDVESDVLFLFTDGMNNEVEIIFDNGEFRDPNAPNMFIYKPMNESARKVFSEIL